MRRIETGLNSLIFALICILLLVTGCRRQEMSVEERNKAIVRRVYDEGINAHDVSALGEFLADGYARHSQASPPNMQEIRDKETFLGFAQAHLDAFPDWNEEILFMVAEGDMVALSTVGRATHTGSMESLEPTGKKVELQHIGVHRINEEGKIAETWVLWDNVAFLTQLGLYPPAGQGEK